MNILSVMLVVACELLTAAHFLRSGEIDFICTIYSASFFTVFKSK